MDCQEDDERDIHILVQLLGGGFAQDPEGEAGHDAKLSDAIASQQGKQNERCRRPATYLVDPLNTFLG